MARPNIQARARTLTGAAVLAALMPAAAFDRQPDDRTAVAVFTSRVERYVRLRTDLEAPLPRFDERQDAWSLVVARRYLGAAIRSARPARMGSVFGPPVEPVMRRLLVERVYEVDVEGLSGWDTELGVDIVVHEPLPAWALEALPAPLLGTLPALPSGLEYRAASGALILWDTHAEIVIDALPQAFAGPD